MGSKHVQTLLTLQEQFGISQSAHGQIEVDVEPCRELGLDKFKVVFNSQTKKWTVSPSSDTPILNGTVVGSKRLKGDSPVNAPTWVDNLPNTEHVQHFRQTKWTDTPLGPLEKWPVSLQVLTNFVMTESMAAVIYWGPQLYAICNAEMVRITHLRLPRGDGNYMGKPFTEIWPDVWAEYGPMIDDVFTRGVPLDTLDINIFTARDGINEESFWNGSFIPVRDLEGKVQGLLNRGRETTQEVITSRRTKTLNAIALPPSPGAFVWEHLFNAFRENDREFPMAFIYKASEEADTGITLHLQQSIGLPSGGHSLVVPKLDLFEGHSGFTPYLRKAKALHRPLVLHRDDGTLPDELVQGFEWKGFGEPSNSIAIIAINASDRLLGVMVMGLNPRRPYDAGYEGFLHSLSRHVSSTITNAVDQEEAKLRAERLSMRLQESERQIREMAVHGPVGMVQVATNGKIQWANDQYYEITGHSPKEEDQYELSFADVVDPRDQEACLDKWKILLEQRISTTIALRLKRTWKPPSGPDDDESKEEPMWVSAASFPISEEGELKYIAAAVTDISHHKWAEAIQSRNAAQAKEAKRLQENFIDIVSHEMRNPLSAITQLADGISTSLEDVGDGTDLEKARSVLNYNVESAKTILICAAHQKRIIDDVLTLSKLDSRMLSITPIVVQPLKVVEAALKMFEGEFQTNGINFETIVDSSYAKTKVDWVCLDPSRMTQIFINLITNAIKFTRLEDRREIKVRTSATFSRPPTVAGVTWFPTHKEYPDLTLNKEWGKGQPVYLCFEVQDTGRGLEPEEMKKLFGRFQQATEKTHIKYGGSGLGLFISRELTETQAGEIGVVSELGKGSTFAFYIKGRLADPPDDPTKIMSPAPTAHGIPRLQKSSSLQLSEHGTDDVLTDPPVVLLVEDNHVNAKVLIRQLERVKCEVYLANHGMEALDFLSKTRAWKNVSAENGAVDLDCILMDTNMPIMDGVTCTRRIRQLEEEGTLIKHVNVIAITADAKQEQLDAILQAGADDVMPKPFRVKELLEKVEGVRLRKGGK